jgi:hypothetical protein
MESGALQSVHLNSTQGSNGTAHFLLFIDYRGHHRKGIAIYNATEGSLQQKIWFHSTKMCF